MRNLGAVEAANQIRNDVFNSPGIDPEQQHEIRFVQSVCSQLGLDHTPDNMQKVAVALHKHDIGLHTGHEYPKMAIRGYDGAQGVVHDEQEQRDWENAETPAVNPTGPVVSGLPPHQQGLDLTKQVPHDDPKDREHPEGRAPSAITNREAAQDAHARHDTGHDGHDGGDIGRELDDGDVHVENVDTLSDNADPAKGGATYAETADTGVMAHDDPDRDGVVGQDKDPTHDSVFGTQEPKNRSGDSSAGKTDTAKRPVGAGNNNPSRKRPM